MWQHRKISCLYYLLQDAFQHIQICHKPVINKFYNVPPFEKESCTLATVCEIPFKYKATLHKHSG